MKTGRRWFTLLLCLVLCCSLLFCSAVVEVGAASIPAGTSVVREFDITANDLVGADVTQLVLRYYSTSQGYQNAVVDESLSPVSYFSSGVPIPSGESWCQFYYYRTGTTDTAFETIFGIRKLYEVDSGKYDFWVSQKLAVEVFSWDMPSSGLASPLSLTVTPYYSNSDGTSIVADNNHAFLVTDIAHTTHSNGGTIHRFSVDLTGNNMVAVAGANIPDGYSFYGFGYRWLWTGEMPMSAYYYHSNFHTSLTYSSSATTDAINEMADKISGEIADMSDQITEQLEAQTEEQRGMFERLGDRIAGFFDTLVEKIKGFFLPSDGYFGTYFADWDEWMEDHFGALYYPFDLILDILDRFLDLEVPDDPEITLPEIKVGDLTLLESQTYVFFEDDSLTALGTLYQLYRSLVVALFVFGLAHLALKKLSEIMGSGN